MALTVPLLKKTTSRDVPGFYWHRAPPCAAHSRIGPLKWQTMISPFSHRGDLGLFCLMVGPIVPRQPKVIYKLVKANYFLVFARDLLGCFLSRPMFFGRCFAWALFPVWRFNAASPISRSSCEPTGACDGRRAVWKRESKSRAWASVSLHAIVLSAHWLSVLW